jgi:spore coat polysaccharide biosynthesis protein SpsF
MILAILQGRLSSTRLPGKVLKELNGKPMILQQINRLKSSNKIDQLVVATSEDSSDDELVQVLQREGIEVRRGPLDDDLAWLQMNSIQKPLSASLLTAHSQMCK